LPSTSTGKLDVKLCDFGLAIDEKDTSTFDFAGTEGFIAPDQVYGGKVSKETDMWAVGMIFASLLLNDSFIPTEYAKKTDWCFSYESDLANLTLQKKIDPLAKDLLMSMVKLNPDERISAEKALKHMYFTSHKQCNC